MGACKRGIASFEACFPDGCEDTVKALEKAQEHGLDLEFLVCRSRDPTFLSRCCLSPSVDVRAMAAENFHTADIDRARLAADDSEAVRRIALRVLADDARASALRRHGRCDVQYICDCACSYNLAHCLWDYGILGWDFGKCRACGSQVRRNVIKITIPSPRRCDPNPGPLGLPVTRVTEP